MSTELLPCPFCGSPAEVDNYDDRAGTFVQCANCFARVSGGSDEWNRRTRSTLVPVLVEALQQIYDRAARAEADGTLMRGALGNIREQAIAALKQAQESQE